MAKIPKYTIKDMSNDKDEMIGCGILIICISIPTCLLILTINIKSL